MLYLAIFLISFITAIILTPLARKLSWQLNTIAIPGGRRRHQGRVPKLGGLPIIGAVSLSLLFVYWRLPPQPDTADSRLLQGVLVGSVVIFIGGLIDDRIELPAWALFLWQLVGLAIAMRHDIFIERFTNPFSGNEQVIESDWIILLLTFIWIVGMINTVNFLDGLDGLATGVATVAALIFAWHSYNLGQLSVAAFPLALAGALLGFLPFNFSPATIFLGSAGAYFIAYQLATLSIIAPAKIATALLVLAVPILDVAWRIIDRIRQGRNPFKGDRGHLHHLLLDRGIPTRWIVLCYYGVASGFGLVAILVESPLLKLVLLIGLGMAVLGPLIWLSLKSTNVIEG